MLNLTETLLYMKCRSREMAVEYYVDLFYEQYTLKLLQWNKNSHFQDLSYPLVIENFYYS